MTESEAQQVSRVRKLADQEEFPEFISDDDLPSQ